MTKQKQITIGGFTMLQIGMIVAAIYAVLCMITGGSVYFIYMASKTTETTTPLPSPIMSTTLPTTTNPTQPTRPTNPTQPTTNPTQPTTNPTQPTTNSTQPTCRILEKGAQCQTKSPCNLVNEKNCRFCSPCTCLCQEPIPIEQFTGSQVRRNSKTVSQWLNLYPPLSAERLLVVTTLLDDMIEPWALVGYFQSCKDDKDVTFNTTCRICQDRSKYVKCVMSSDLKEESVPSQEGKWAKLKGWFNRDNTFLEMRLSLPFFIYLSTRVPSVVENWEFDRNIKVFQKEIDVMTVNTVLGGQCKVCADFNAKTYHNCINQRSANKRDAGSITTHLQPETKLILILLLALMVTYYYYF